jgi:predicted enzyme related to lactoylglutathione lyase
MYFELPSDNPEKLTKFYCDVFGWTRKKWDGDMDYWMLFTGMPDKPGMNGGVMGRFMMGTINTIEVSDIDAATAKVEANGGKITTPKTEMPEVGLFAWCVDTDDNYFVLGQLDKKSSVWNTVPDGTPNSEWQNRPIHFEIPGTKPAELVKFYEKVFGWKAEKWQGPMDYFIVDTGAKEEAGINGAITVKGDIQHPVNTIGVDNIDTYMDKILSLGGSIHTPKDDIPMVGQFAYCIDPDGNQFGLLQPDMTEM